MPSLQVHDVIDGRFVLKELLGQGGVGTVWRATQLPHNQPVALKLLRPEMASLPHLRRRFAREARAASRLEHPNIAAVYESDVDDRGYMFMSMELVEGDHVARLIETGLSLVHVLQLTDQLLSGLAHAHARGVVHRDLKPANVLVAGSALPRVLGVAKIVDFGIATVLTDTSDGRDTLHGEVVGTPRYMSPEQAAGERNLTPRTDLYNVGLILYELVTGRAPYGDHKGLAVMSKHVHEPVPPMVPRAGLPHWPELEAFVMRALAKDPAERWPSATEMRTALMPLLERAGVDALAQRAPTPGVVEDGASGGEAGAGPRERDTLEESFVPGAAGRTLVEFPTLDDEPEVMDVASFQRVPFVGRPRERAWLTELVTRIRLTERGCVVLIEGEAGVGKTRLTMWFKERVEEQGLLQGHIGAFTRGTSGGLRGLQEVLDSLFGTRNMPSEEVYARVLARLRDWSGSEHLEDARAITDFLRPASAASDTDQRAPGHQQAQALFATIVRVLEMASQVRGRLIILDDVHWAGSELADFLDYLAVEMRHRPIALMVIATIRSEDLGENPVLEERLGGLSRYLGETVERVALGRLKRAPGSELVRALLPVDEALTDIVYERSGGNPLHLVMLLRYLRNEGLLEWVDGQWQARDAGAVRAAVPPSLADLFAVRVQQVEARYGTGRRLTELLHRAAVLGSRFSYDVLHELVALEGNAERLERFDEDFERLLSEGLIVESHGRREDWYTFSHALVRDFFSRDAPAQRARRRLHRLAAEAMERVYGRGRDAYALEIAGHWYHARVPERALHWYRKAADTALRSYMLRQAADALEHCVELSEQLLGLEPRASASAGAAAGRTSAGLQHVALASAAVTVADDGDAAQWADYLELLVQLGDLYEGFGDFAHAEAVYRRVVQLVSRTPPVVEGPELQALSKSWLGLGHIAWQRGDFEAANWAFQRVRDLIAGRAGLLATDEAAALGLARVAWHRGDYARARGLARAALDSATTRGDVPGRADALWLLGEIARVHGHGEDASRHYRRSLELYEAENMPTGIARNLLSLAQLARYQKAFAEAEQLYRETLARYESLGDRRGMGNCYNGLGDIARFQSHYADARRNYDRALEIYGAIGAQYDVAVVYANLGLTATATADYDGAKTYMHAARNLVGGDDYPYLTAGIEFNLALVEALRGAHEESSAILEKVLELSERFPIADIDYAQPLEQLARLSLEAGSPARARRLWAKAAELYRELDLHEDLARVEACLKM